MLSVITAPAASLPPWLVPVTAYSRTSPGWAGTVPARLVTAFSVITQGDVPNWTPSRKLPMAPLPPAALIDAKAKRVMVWPAGMV